jgi:hypothetical protein
MRTGALLPGASNSISRGRNGPRTEEPGDRAKRNGMTLLYYARSVRGDRCCVAWCIEQCGGLGMQAGATPREERGAGATIFAAPEARCAYVYGLYRSRSSVSHSCFPFLPFLSILHPPTYPANTDVYPGSNYSARARGQRRGRGWWRGWRQGLVGQVRFVDAQCSGTCGSIFLRA